MFGCFMVSFGWLWETLHQWRQFRHKKNEKKKSASDEIWNSPFSFRFSTFTWHQVESCSPQNCDVKWKKITSCIDEIHVNFRNFQNKLKNKTKNSKMISPWCHCTPGGFVISFTQVIKKRRMGGKIAGGGGGGHECFFTFFLFLFLYIRSGWL